MAASASGVGSRVRAVDGRREVAERVGQRPQAGQARGGGRRRNPAVLGTQEGVHARRQIAGSFRHERGMLPFGLGHRDGDPLAQRVHPARERELAGVGFRPQRDAGIGGDRQRLREGPARRWSIRRCIARAAPTPRRRTGCLGEGGGAA